MTTTLPSFKSFRSGVHTHVVTMTNSSQYRHNRTTSSTT